MSKTLKMSMLLIVITLGCLFFTGMEVNAADIYSAATLKEVFNGKNATIEGTTITLTGNIEDNDIFDISGEDYILNLNGYKFTAGEVHINGGSVTINDTTGNGQLDTTLDWLYVEEGAELIINNGKFDYLVNAGKTTINNGSVESINNDGTMVIEKGTFGGIWQRGNATIKGGTFSNESMNSSIDLNGKTTVLTGGEFKSLLINSGSEISPESINDIVGDGYIAVYNGYGTNAPESWVDEVTGETIYRYEVSYDTIKIIKDETDAIFNKTAPNGVWTINGAKPKNMDEAEFLLSAIAGDIDIPDGFELFAFCEPVDDMFNPEDVSLTIYYNNAYVKSKSVKAVYNEPSDAVKTKVDSILEKIAEKTGEESDVDTGFRVEDLYLINYLNTSKKGINGSLALNFSKDLIELTNGGNISYKYDSRKGAFTPTGLWSFTGGQVIVYHDSIATGTTEIGLTTNHVLYIPSDTADNDEARIAAALKRIENYLGTTKGITISVGGTLESLNNDGFTWKDYGFIDDTTSGTNYYNVTINNKTYKFAICKKEMNKLETPKYIGCDLTSKISITSDVTTIPLDTAVSVKEVKDDTIKKALGTEKYTAFDISLYSNTKNEKITKLENGNFEVKIPVPESLKNKDLSVYYIDENGKKEEHTATVKDGYVIFETNHFSTYALSEKAEKDDVPKMGSINIIKYVIVATIITGVGIVTLRKKD